MAAKGMALAEFLVKIGFNTKEINKQLDAIEKRLNDILVKRRSVTGKALKDEKALLDIKKKELDIATKESRLAATRARTAAAEARARLTATRATERAARAARRAEPLPAHPGKPYLTRRGREARQAAKDYLLQGPQHPGKAFLNRRARELRGIQGGARRSEDPAYISARKATMLAQVETMHKGGKISTSSYQALTGELTSANSLRGLAVARGNLAQAAREARRLRSELTLANVASQRLASSTRQMMGNYVSTFAMAGGAAMAGRSSMAVESARAQLYGANFGDQAAANSDYDFFRQMSLQYGTGMAESIKSFSGFKYAGGNIMDTAQMRELFQSMTLAGVAGGATQADMGRTFYALKQMASKGKITSEELNLQLAEANPLAKLGIEKAFEEFTGRDRSEMMDMMKRGEVYAKDILPLVAKHLNEISAKGVEAGLKTASKQLDILRASAADLAATFGESGGNEGLADIFKGFTKSIKQAAPLIRVLGGLFKEFSTIVVATSHIFGGFAQSVGRNIEFINDKLGMAFGTGTAEGIRFWVKAVMWRFFPLLSMLREMMAIMEELFNFFETDPSKKIYGKLSNPEGTGAWDKWHTTTGADMATSFTELYAPKFLTDFGRWLGGKAYGVDEALGIIVNGNIILQNAKDPENLAEQVMERTLSSASMFLVGGR